ncbi:MAG: TPM domain-containing protein [Steroidobacteraceae bacterium]
MSLARAWRHALAALRPARRLLEPDALDRITAEVVRAEATHAGEIRVAIETTLTAGQLWQGLAPRARALQVFSALGVWDTAGNNGVLIYLLLADRSVEIIADRAIAALVPESDWLALCRDIEQRCRDGDIGAACCQAVRGVAAVVARHFPRTGGDGDELPNQAILL